MKAGKGMDEVITRAMPLPMPRLAPVTRTDRPKIDPVCMPVLHPSYSRLLVALVALRPSHRPPASKITYDGAIHGLAKSRTQGSVLTRVTRDV